MAGLKRSEQDALWYTYSNHIVVWQGPGWYHLQDGGQVDPCWTHVSDGLMGSGPYDVYFPSVSMLQEHHTPAYGPAESAFSDGVTQVTKRRPGGPYIYETHEARGFDIEAYLNEKYNNGVTLASHCLIAGYDNQATHVFLFHRSSVLTWQHDTGAREQFEKDCAAICDGCRHHIPRVAHPELPQNPWTHELDGYGAHQYIGPCYAWRLHEAWAKTHKEADNAA